MFLHQWHSRNRKESSVCTVQEFLCDASVFGRVIVLRLLVKLKMHKLVFVYIIVFIIIMIIIINDRYFAIWLIEHKLGWLQQCRALSKHLSVQYLFHFFNKCGDPSYIGFVLKPSTQVVTNGLCCTDFVSKADTINT